MADEIVLTELESGEKKVEKEQFMTFTCGEEIYGISLGYVNEIIGLQRITSVPDSEKYIKGLINLRGKIIPVIDIRIRFGIEQKEYNDRTCVIVLKVDTTVIGVIVDKIAEVVAINKEHITPPPSVSNVAEQTKKFVYGIGRINGEVKLLLDPNKLIHGATEEEIARVMALQEENQE